MAEWTTLANGSVVTVTDEEDPMAAENSLRNDLTRIIALLAPRKEDISRIVFESTLNWH